MKNKIYDKFLSILLTLAMAVSVLPAFSIVASAETAVCYIDADITDGGFNESKDLKYDSVQAAIDTAGTTPTAIVMINDSKENVTIAPTQEITLNLDGYVLSGKANDKGVIYIGQEGENYGKLTVKDSNTGKLTHNFKVGSDGLWTLTDETADAKPFETLTDHPAAGDIITVSGGCITGGNSQEPGSGGGVQNWGSLHLLSGNIVGNKASGNGGGIWSQYETFISGGNIMGNIAACNGGGIYSNGTLEISNGNILYNTAEAKGGGVHHDYGEFNLSGGTISGNHAGANGGGIYHEALYFGESDFSAPMVIGGTAVVKDNALSNSAISNLCIFDEKYNKCSVEIGTGGAAGVPVPAKGMCVGVTLGTTSDGMGPFTANGTAKDTQYFFSDNPALGVRFVDAASSPASAAHLELATGYAITNNTPKADREANHGYVTVYPSACSGGAVYVAVIPDTDYLPDTLKISKTSDGSDVTDIVNYSSTTGIFTMPGYAVTVSAGFMLMHEHFWSYSVDGSGTTLIATCSGTGTHSGTNPETLTIAAPTLTEYGETGKSEKATLSAMSLGEYSVSADTIKYEGRETTDYEESTTAPTAAGFYKASITVGGNTACVDYTISPKPLHVTADAISSYVGSDLAALTYTAGALCSGDSFSGALATNADKNTVGSTYTITQGSLTAGSNYAISFTGASYTVKALTLALDANGGNAADSITVLSWKDTVAVIPEASKTGYTLREWNTKADGTGSKLDTATQIEANATYYAIWTPNSYTVTFLANNGTGTMDAQSFTYDAEQALTKSAFSRSGYNFTGWAKTAKAEYAEYLDEAAVINLTADAGGNVNLYAIWTAKPVYSISGIVQQAADAAPENVPDALVELKQGQTVVASTRTGADGSYTFSGIISGEYNIIVTGHASGTEDKIKTALVLLEDANKSGVDVLLPQGYVSSVVEVKDNTPQVVVGGLDDEAAMQAGGNLTDTIRIVLSVESAADITAAAGAPAAEVAAQTAIKSEAGSKTVEFIDMDVTKYINTADSTIHETNSVLEIIIPYATDSKTDIAVYRFHDADSDGTLDAGQQISMTKLSTRPAASYEDSSYYVGNGYIAVYTKFFSTYAIGYMKVSGNSGNDSGKVSRTDKTAAGAACPQDETCVYAKFTDADTKAWYHDGVHFCVEKAYMNGVSSTRFVPDGTLSRAMIVMILWNMEENPVANYAMTFNDVPADLWYTEAIRWAQSTGVVEGYNDEAFGPDDYVTREQLAAILYRYAAYKGYSVSDLADLAVFTDKNTISSWAIDSVKWANAAGIIYGRTAGTIVPLGNATRAEAACMIQRFCDKVVR